LIFPFVNYKKTKHCMSHFLQSVTSKCCTLLFGASLLSVSLSAQVAKVSVADEKWQDGGAFGGYKPGQEVLEKRNRNAKHFQNADGSFTVQTGNVYHYKDAAGAWQDIDLTIKPAGRNDGTGYANVTNEIKDYFPANPANGGAISMTTENGTTFKWWSMPELSLSSAGNVRTIAPPARVSGVLEKNSLTYPHLYEGISEQFVTMKSGIENNTLIHALSQDIRNLPAAGMIELSHFVAMGPGWKVDVDGQVKTGDFTSKEFHIDVPGTEMGVYFGPIVAFDNTLTQQEALYARFAPAGKLTSAELRQKEQNTLQCNYSIKFVPGGIRVITMMPADWLKTAGRSFPVTIDPTVTFTPTPLYSGGWFYSPMSHWYGFQRHANLYLSSELGISNVNITAIEYQRTNTSGTNASKPAKVFMRTTTATTLTGTAAWNSTTYTGGLTALYNNTADFHGTSTGWKMMTLSLPFNYASGNLLVMVYDEYGGSGSAKYMSMCDVYSSARQACKRDDNTDPGDGTPTAVESKLPEIRITYGLAAPPSCITAPLTPANAATGVCSGTTTLRWNAAPGATGYNVFFNTGTTATTSVATNQADTFFVAPTPAIGAYAWRIVPRNSVGEATSCNTFTFTTIAGTTPTATITVGPNDTLCPTIPATFTATNTDGGTTPAYQWMKNGVNVGTNSPTYTTGNLADNDTIKVVMTSNSTGCLTTSVVSSNVIKMHILPVPSIVITPSGPTEFCSGGSVTLRATTGAVSYQWANVNGNIAGATGSSYTAAYSDHYTVIAGSSSLCKTIADSVVVTSRQLPYPVLTITGNTLSTTASFASYQWYNGTTLIPGATTNSYTPVQPGRYNVKVTDMFGCSGTSFSLPVSVGNVAAAEIVVYPNPATNVININSTSAVNAAIRSMDGKLVLEQKDAKTVDISALATGVYMLYLSDQKGNVISVEKLVKRAGN
jgi:hypothetical protein